MLFNSFEYLLFFPLVAIVYFLLPLRAGWAWLLAAGMFFYMWLIPQYIIVLGIAIGIDYVAGIFIERSATSVQRKFWLWTSVLSTCALLFIFKYHDFFAINTALLADKIGWHYTPFLLKWALPVGLSFHTFQSLAYVIEVYYGRQKAEYNLAVYSLYVLFFPQLVAGPIERPQKLLHQFYKKYNFDYDRVCDGLRLVFWGLFKKVVIADRAAILVNEVYGHPQDYPGGVLWFTSLFFAIQIYCDFSGYSDMAIGSARVLGYDLSMNFNAPYLAKSVTEFWRRWHISLSSWFRDYVYISLGGNKGNWLFRFRNVFIVFALSGFWHGAAWNFVAWGVAHALLLIGELIFKQIFPAKDTVTTPSVMSKLKNAMAYIYTFTAVCMAWVFFRAETLEKAIYILKTMILHPFNGIGTFISTTKDIVMGRVNMCIELMFGGHDLGLWFGQVLLVMIAASIMFVLDILNERRSMALRLANLPQLGRWGIYWLLIWSVIILGEFNSGVEFIYFQF